MKTNKSSMSKVRQKGISPSLSKLGLTVKLSKSPMNSIATTKPNSNGVIKHQRPMEHKHADSFLSDKGKFLKKYGKNMIDREVKK